jgi:hypothetical protein
MFDKVFAVNEIMLRNMVETQVKSGSEIWWRHRSRVTQKYGGDTGQVWLRKDAICNNTGTNP